MNILDVINEIIIEKVNPDKIILFGSRARGDNKLDSDYDILILKDNISDRAVVGMIYKEFFYRKINVAVDLLTLDNKKYDDLNEVNGYVYKQIKKEGKVIWSRTENG